MQQTWAKPNELSRCRTSMSIQSRAHRIMEHDGSPFAEAQTGNKNRRNMDDGSVPRANRAPRSKPKERLA